MMPTQLYKQQKWINMKASTKLAVAGFVVTLLSGCSTPPLVKEVFSRNGQIFTGQVAVVNNEVHLMAMRPLINKAHIDMSKYDFAQVNVEQGLNENINVGVFAPKSTRLHRNDFIEFQAATKDREYKVLTRVIQRADEKGPCKWEGNVWGRAGGVVCNK